jgi:hypothetical protein
LGSSKRDLAPDDQLTCHGQQMDNAAVSAPSSRSSAASSPDHGTVRVAAGEGGCLYRAALLFPASRGVSESIFPRPRHPPRGLALVFPLQAPGREARATHPGSEIALLRRYGGYGVWMPEAAKASDLRAHPPRRPLSLVGGPVVGVFGGRINIWTTSSSSVPLRPRPLKRCCQIEEPPSSPLDIITSSHQTTLNIVCSRGQHHCPFLPSFPSASLALRNARCRHLQPSLQPDCTIHHASFREAPPKSPHRPPSSPSSSEDIIIPRRIRCLVLDTLPFVDASLSQTSTHHHHSLPTYPRPRQ